MRPSRNLTAMMSRAVREGNQWMTGNYQDPNQPLEHVLLVRLGAVPEFSRVGDRDQTDPNPPWYQDGVDFLQQQAEFGWLLDTPIVARR